jgi:hypothetical protein
MWVFFRIQILWAGFRDAQRLRLSFVRGNGELVLLQCGSKMPPETPVLLSIFTTSLCRRLMR